MKNAQEWLYETYPTKNQKEKVRKIFIDRKERESFPEFQLFSNNSENNHYLDIKLEKELDLSDFVNLEVLCINNQKITELNVSNCSKLTYLNCSNNELKSLNLGNLINLKTILCSNNFLTELDLFSQNSEKLFSLHIGNNNFSCCDLSGFSRFTKLHSLHLGTDNKERINRSIYNRFFGVH
jgi:Leucine-rich repeat (LRR) protein